MSAQVAKKEVSTDDLMTPLAGSPISGVLVITLLEVDSQLSVSLGGFGNGWLTANRSLILRPTSRQSTPVQYTFEVTLADSTGQGYTLADPFAQLTSDDGGFGLVLGGTSFSLYVNLAAGTLSRVPLNMVVIVQDATGQKQYIDDPTIIFDAPPTT